MLAGVLVAELGEASGAVRGPVLAAAGLGDRTEGQEFAG